MAVAYALKYFWIVAMAACTGAVAGGNSMKTREGQNSQTLEVQPDDDYEDDGESCCNSSRLLYTQLTTITGIMFSDELGTSYEGALGSMTSLHPEVWLS
ncbi:hypothetical protein BESB_020210 [Besnoitia besnoiti]|uniref:Uncharacterized protein n=1 Tax=Besnoitia besnoiti TaxID=94643 RepID=A0A2A9M9M2_BESBE|nr:hypothetical protein BESB_020210 [Besnoitia besnoiti]PFH32080.1 hypothetical protein BESB_020210 [Besnoitia besnoiti]